MLLTFSALPIHIAPDRRRDDPSAIKNGEDSNGRH